MLMKMKPLLVVACCSIFPALAASGANLMLDFGGIAMPALDPNLIRSAGHSAGVIPNTETTWNTISSGTPGALTYSDGSAAAGVTLTMGAEASFNSGTVNFDGTIGNTAFAGSGGGVAGFQSYLTTNSIYGTTNNAANTAHGRDGFIAGGTGGAGFAMGLRLDGLAAGTYAVYLMARNTSANGAAGPMSIYAQTGVSTDTSYAFGTTPVTVQANPVYTSGTGGTYTGQYTTFIEGDNYARFEITLAENESLMIAIDGSGAETRGFLNSMQIVAIPEPATALLGSLALLGFLRRRR